MTECTECGRELAAHELDVGFSLPDEVWELAPSDRSRRADSTSDVCVLDGTRFFIRAVAFLPVEATQESFCWGLWVEVSGKDFERCRQSSDLDAPGKPSGRGTIANSPQGYPPLTGHPVAIEHRGAHERPWLHLEASDHPMSREQREGVSCSRVHELVRPFHPAPTEESDATWPFDQAPNVAAITTVQVLTQNAPILRVTHYSDDHSWAFLCDTTGDTSDGRLISMASAVGLDPTVQEVADLPPGWTATRAAPGTPWDRKWDPDM